MPYHRASQNNSAVYSARLSFFASRRRDDLVPEMTLQANHELLTLTLPQGWLTQHPLGKEIIDQESQWQSYVHWPLEVH